MKIGVFDSGVGGLSVLRAVRAEVPAANLLYLADAAHLPYGARPLAEVRQYAEGITRFLLAHGAEVIVLACHTASAAALRHLRQAWPAVPFVGMEPAVKPAAESTRSGVVGVLATPATFQGELYASVVERFAQGTRVIGQECPGLVQQIEAGEVASPATERLLRGWLEPLVAQGIDALVLGCTHYPFVRPLIEHICGPGVRVIDPAPAVARQVARVAGGGPPAPAVAAGQTTYFTTGSPQAFAQALDRLGFERSELRATHWVAEALEPAPG